MPFSAKVRFEQDQVIRFQVKIGDVVLGPAVAPAGEPEPHPFGRVLDRLLDLRGISSIDAAERVARAKSTIVGLRRGRVNPLGSHVQEMAWLLDIAEGDLRAVAGFDA